MYFEPFILSPVGKDYLWGGIRLKEKYNKSDINLSPLAETWECSTHPAGQSSILTGIFKGELLSDIIFKYPEILGKLNTTVQAGAIPILIKFIDAKEDLSIQVHPNDEFAFKYEGGQFGKTEFWYVLESTLNARIIYGVNRTLTRKDLLKAVKNGNLELYLNEVQVKNGDCFLIKAGMIHAIGKGNLIVEIQESSDLTYRLYDYNRLDKSGKHRELQLDKVIKVAQLEPECNYLSQSILFEYDCNRIKKTLAKCKYFTVEFWKIYFMYDIKCLYKTFQVIVVTEGEGELVWKDDKLKLKKGTTVFIPAKSDKLRIIGNIEMLFVIPN